MAVAGEPGVAEFNSVRTSSIPSNYSISERILGLFPTIRVIHVSGYEAAFFISPCVMYHVLSNASAKTPCVWVWIHEAPNLENGTHCPQDSKLPTKSHRSISSRSSIGRWVANSNLAIVNHVTSTTLTIRAVQVLGFTGAKYGVEGWMREVVLLAF